MKYLLIFSLLLNLNYVENTHPNIQNYGNICFGLGCKDH